MINVKPKKYLTFCIIVISIFIVFAFVAWLFWGDRLEFGKPSFRCNVDIRTLGFQNSLHLTFSDTQSGLSRTDVSLSQDGKNYPLSTITYPPGKFKTYDVNIILDPARISLHEGPATLHISAKDNALFSNQFTTNQPVMIDFGPPQIFLLNSQNHINPGGTCVVAYRVSEPVTMTGVFVNQLFFKAYPILLSGKSGFIVFFAMPKEAILNPVNIRVVARDQGGNESSVSVPYLLMNKSFRSDKMMLSETFLQQKMPEFQVNYPQLRGKPLLDTFIFVNTQMRADNFKTIQTICQKTESRQLWNDTFLRMKNASPMALFGDHRTYIYDGKPIGESVHEGVDLASTTQAPIEASNSGKVVFTGQLGIYGNTVIIDHGFGLSSLYAHLSSISVKNSQTVAKGEVIGNSGLSGLAGGDHLHFGMVVGGQFVNPQEWWDPHWIKDNVFKKLEVSF
ncbi:MAG: Murein DD-endopeptidase MepM [Syntrophus sp. PtaB.Bin001]|nr:MAG: Murein DD-endopeptidase MepM [Syntrophus sp. PtaB.Bin001]